VRRALGGEGLRGERRLGLELGDTRRVRIGALRVTLGPEGVLCRQLLLPRIELRLLRVRVRIRVRVRAS